MISNPPFSIQNEIIRRSFDLINQGKIKSFALLLPLATLETQKIADDKVKYHDFILWITSKWSEFDDNRGIKCWYPKNTVVYKDFDKFIGEGEQLELFKK